MLLRDLRHAGPFRVVVSHPHLLDRRQVNHAHLEMTGGERASLHVVVDVFRKPGKEELEVGIGLRLHRHRFPGPPSTLIVGKQLHLFRLEADDLGGDQLVAVAPHGNVAGCNPDVIERHSFGSRPEQGRPIAQVAGTRGDQPRQHAQAGNTRARKEIQLVIGYQVCRLRVPGNGKCVRGQQLEERIISFLFPVIEGKQPLLKFRVGRFGHLCGAAARQAPQGKRESKGCGQQAITISNSERAPVSPRTGKANAFRIRTRRMVVISAVAVRMARHAAIHPDATAGAIAGYRG